MNHLSLFQVHHHVFYHLLYHQGNIFYYLIQQNNKIHNHHLQLLLLILWSYLERPHQTLHQQHFLFDSIHYFDECYELNHLKMTHFLILNHSYLIKIYIFSFLFFIFSFLKFDLILFQYYFLLTFLWREFFQAVTYFNFIKFYQI